MTDIPASLTDELFGIGPLQARALIIDTETTGLDAPEAIAVALLPVRAPRHLGELRATQAFYKPSKPIELGALAVHGIFDEELEDYPPSGSFQLPAGAEYLIGHNVDFDWKVIGQPDVKRICTLALSRMIWPKADSHRLWSMICLIDRDYAKRLMINDAHSASGDAYACRLLLSMILKKLSHITTWEELWLASEEARRLNETREPPATVGAADILERAAQHIRDRAALRDTPNGERSMGKAVWAFNSIFSTDLTEREGWQFMELLKIARSSAGGHSPDDFEDGAAYAALAGECAAEQAVK